MTRGQHEVLSLKGAVIALAYFAGLWKVAYHRVGPRTEQQLISCVWTTLLPASPFTSLSWPAQGQDPYDHKWGSQDAWLQKQTPLESPDLSSSWLNPSFSLEEKGRPA